METEGVKKEGSDVPVLRRVRLEDQFVQHSWFKHRGDSGSYYECKTCGRAAREEHNNPECHLCEDWNGCGRDCTLSRVYCPECGVEAEVWIR